MEASQALRRCVLRISSQHPLNISTPATRSLLAPLSRSFTTESSPPGPGQDPNPEAKDLRSIISALSASKPSRPSQTASAAFDALKSNANTSISTRNQSVWEQLRSELNRPQLFEAKSYMALRLKPTLGRTLDISPRHDVTRALRNLERKCSENRVKTDSIAQRNHVRRGQRRKNVKMRRWRALFKEGFVAECAKIRRLKNQGW